ncbi:DUF6973 domain-containing protein [Candidatus Enterococcus mansonii]|uniref:DUF6973 domain-containing protein n=1 Tax=Candidatus Enterococcus mansonii TaxID=1834181 RepID=UPI003AF9BA89
MASNAASKTFKIKTADWDGSDGNAMQHFYWNMLMTNRYGTAVADRWASAHEAHGFNDIHTRMDLANNSE